MNFQLTEEQEMIRLKAREFAQREIAPVIGWMEENDAFPIDVVKRMGEAGLMGIPVPKEWGGTGHDYTSYILAIQEISKVSATVGVILSVHTSVGTNPILYYGNEPQKEKYVPKLASGAYIGAFALTESGAGSDSASIRTSAVKRGDRYILNGSKMFITNSGYADTYVAFAVTDPSQGTRGISAFIIDKDTPGFSIGKKEAKMGLHGSSTCEVIFEQAEVPVENLLGAEGEGLKIALGNLDMGRIGIAAQALGIAEAALACSLDAVKSGARSHEAVLASMATQVEAAKLLVYRAACLRTNGLKCTKEASMAKRYSTDTAMKAASEAISILGEKGATRDYPVERLFRDAKATQIYEGTNEIQRLVISKYTLV